MAVVIQCCLRQQYSTLSRGKYDTSDASSADLNKRVVFAPTK
jgi:hypothetical protein